MTKRPPPVSTTNDEPPIQEYTAIGIEVLLNPEFVKKKRRNCWSPLAGLLIEPLWSRAKAISILASLYPLENPSSNELVWLVERPSIWANISLIKTWRRACWHYAIVATRLHNFNAPMAPKLWIFAARDAGISPHWWSDLVELERTSSAQKAKLRKLRELLPMFETLSEKNRFARNSGQQKSAKKYVAREKFKSEVRETWESWCLGEVSFKSKKSFLGWACRSGNETEDETTGSERTDSARDGLDREELGRSDKQHAEFDSRRKLVEFWLDRWEKESYVTYGMIDEPGKPLRKGYGHPALVVPVKDWKHVKNGSGTWGWIKPPLPRFMLNNRTGLPLQGNLRGCEVIQTVDELLANAAIRRQGNPS